MNTQPTKKIGLFLVAALIATGCAPMNADKKTADTSNTVVQAGPVGAAKTSANNQYVVFVNSIEPTATAVTKRNPSVGENTFLIRSVRSDLTTIAADATIIATYEMIEMPEMGKTDETATRQTDGSYRVTLVFSMPGTWRVTVKIQDGVAQDTYVFDTKI